MQQNKPDFCRHSVSAVLTPLARKKNRFTESTAGVLVKK